MTDHAHDMIFRIAGDGGEGIISCGDLIAAACARSGLEVYTFKTFPAEVRGGYAMYQVRAGMKALHNQGDSFDIFCALNSEAYGLNRSHLVPGTVLVYDDSFSPDIPDGVLAFPIPMTTASKGLGFKKAKNMVALGAISELFNIPAKTLKDVLSDKFRSKGEKVLRSNLAAFDKGAELATGMEKIDKLQLSKGTESKDVIMISGNEAIGLGALIGGLDFFSAYPITPASEIAKYLAMHLPKTGGSLIQAEDEIASISQVIGASFAGKKAMTATSGPGISLMSEMLGFAFMSETPTVVVDVQRGGPSTGLPTKHEQSDLFAAIYGSHGDAVRIVLSVENVADCISMTVDAMNIAENYQSPVILLSESSLAFSSQTIPTPDPDLIEVVQRKRWGGEGEYQRYEMTADFISPMADPGTPCALHIATGLEHKADGRPAFTQDNHEMMSNKRFDKLKSLPDHYHPVEIDGDVKIEADIGIIAWGSTIGVVREAIARLRGEGISVKGFYPKLLWPMQVDQFESFAERCNTILVVEVNHQGQLAHLIRAETSLNPFSHTICGGMPFTPANIEAAVREQL
ncbi:2-oxoglutarate ferredoxin oxidoreductase subunit alpha [Mariprofundus aestuarium]|uniref:2-oxoglutarate ferredoxin oxidoreductase subunit alpha n=1 Tax=Mariprofundus aestuarium TaxID=1921086 RepID=A0A2K8KX72_MARES|nr:2-oxoacid:acceptor oxidoreductase subunit alpha [Mariprofundus aestuarium]ATX79453.1 2-oxoglutarate ferredoxin oxidoreductase subunit alpha [Mariprofundus aestuarium]